MDISELLEHHTPKGCEPIRRLYEWPDDYSPGQAPFLLFLDLIGYSYDEYGFRLYRQEPPNLGYMDLYKLGDALKAYADRPLDVCEYINAILDAEGEP